MSDLFPLTLKPGKADDIPALVALGVAANATSIGRLPEFAGRERDIEAAFDAFLKKDIADIIVADADGTLVGFCATEGQSDEVSDLWVAPDHHGKGVGGVLLAAAEARIKAWGFSRAWLTTHAQNSRAISFYRSQGYAVLKRFTSQSVALPDVTYPQVALSKQFARPSGAGLHTMDEVRQAIDLLDPVLVSLLDERFSFVDRASVLKPGLGLPADIPKRVEEVVSNARQQAEHMSFDPDLTEQIWRMMVRLAVVREEAAMTSRAPDTSSRPQKAAS